MAGKENIGAATAEDPVAIGVHLEEIVTFMQTVARRLLPKRRLSEPQPAVDGLAIGTQFGRDPRVLPLFQAGKYVSAVRRGCDALRASIRNKTGLQNLDGAPLVNEAHGKERPFKLPVWESHSEKNVRQGYMDMLRGAMMGIWNPHYHGTEELQEMEAARLLVMLVTLWARTEGTTGG